MNIASPEVQAVTAVAVSAEPMFPTKPLSTFVRSKLNVRKKKGTKIAELAASIFAHGLLQNLIGYEQKKRGKPTGIIEVVSGGRRLEGMHLLRSEGKITDEYVVPYRLVSEEEAIEISLAENSGREDMCLADQFEAMKTLIDNNKSIEEVAVAFGMSPLTVQRWLKLANVSPRLFALFRDDEITIEHMLALAQTDDHELQEQVWDSLPSHSRQPFRIRELLTKGEINMKTDPVARYVGAAAYEKAGGTIRRDLFSDNDSGFMTDSALLMTLAQAKLAKAAKQVEKEGFAWVEPRIRLDYSERNTYGHIRTVRLTPTPEQQAALDAIDAEEKTLDAERDAADDDADEDAFEQRSDDLEQRRDEIESALAAPHPDDKAVAGAIVTIGHGGKIEIIRNLVRPEDKRMLARAGGGSAEDGKEKPTHSERLTRQLTAQRTAALQAALITMPDIALIALTSRLASQVFSHYGRGEQIVKVNLITAHLRGADDSIEESRAWKELQAKHEEWKQRIPDDDEQSMFTWLLTQPQVVVLDLLAYCTARSLDSVQSREDSHSGFNEMAKAIDLNMANWWMPTKTTYLDHVKKNRIVEVVTEAVSAEAAEPLGSMKKDAMIDAAERALAGTGWLPNILKVS